MSIEYFIIYSLLAIIIFGNNKCSYNNPNTLNIKIGPVINKTKIK